MKEEKIFIYCPSCKIKMIWNSNNPFRPFCSRHCKLIDFKEWMREEVE